VASVKVNLGRANLFNLTFKLVAKSFSNQAHLGSKANISAQGWNVLRKGTAYNKICMWPSFDC